MISGRKSFQFSVQSLILKSYTVLNKARWLHTGFFSPARFNPLFYFRYNLNFGHVKNLQELYSCIIMVADFDTQTWDFSISKAGFAWRASKNLYQKSETLLFKFLLQVV